MTTQNVHDSRKIPQVKRKDLGGRVQFALRDTVRTSVSTFSDAVRQFLTWHLDGLEHQVYGLLYFNRRQHWIGYENLFRGTLDYVTVHPREVVRAAMERNAKSVIGFRNDLCCVQPSQLDRSVTRQVKEALALVGISFADHLIVGEGCYSFADHGEL